MNLIAGIHEQMNRARELRKHYEDIGDAGMFGKIIIGDAIEKAEKAIESGDAVKMLSAYFELEELE
ncbi:MAG: hypothetical protein Q8M94_19675 [Ignavibacteria bacterium]|nr:hypothetical protein [Ignavibacteria bacterium]